MEKWQVNAFKLRRKESLKSLRCCFHEKAGNTSFGWYQRCAGNVVIYALSPKILGLKTKDRPGSVDP